VFNSDSIIVYEINRHFEYDENRKEIFLSNDGQIIASVLNREFEWEGAQNYNVEIFKNGISVKQMHLNDLIKCNSAEESCYLFYKEAIDSIFWNEIGHLQINYKIDATDFEKQLTEKATFLNNDTLYIFTKTSELISLDLKTLNFTSIPLSEVNPEIFKNIKPYLTYESIFISPSSSNHLPNLENGISFETGLAKSLKMKIFNKNLEGANEYKKYFVCVEILLDKNGKAVLTNINKNLELPKEKIEQFITSQKFDTHLIPSECDKWIFEGFFDLMKKNKIIAKREKKKEIKIKRVWIRN
jgi:hypothetical protein